jgi:aspartate/methionine/tyrosine aminotransferase
MHNMAFLFNHSMPSFFLAKVQDTIPICPARISQVAALGALKAGRSWVLEQVATLDTGRESILEAMAPLKVIMGGTGAMYIMGKLPNGMDDQVRALAGIVQVLLAFKSLLTLRPFILYCRRQRENL